MSYPNEASTQTIKDQHSSKEFSQPETPNDMNNDQASRGSFNTQTTDNLQVIEHRCIQWDNRQYNTSRSGFRGGPTDNKQTRSITPKWALYSYSNNARGGPPSPYLTYITTETREYEKLRLSLVIPKGRGAPHRKIQTPLVHIQTWQLSESGLVLTVS